MPAGRGSQVMSHARVASPLVIQGAFFTRAIGRLSTVDSAARLGSWAVWLGEERGAGGAAARAARRAETLRDANPSSSRGHL